MRTDLKSNQDPKGNGYNRQRPYSKEAYLQETPRRQRITQRDIREHYGTEENCEALFVGLRWPNGVKCPCCQGRDIHRITTRRKFTCRDCDYRFTVTSGTYMHGTRTPLSTWLTVAYEMIRGCARHLGQRGQEKGAHRIWHGVVRLPDHP